MPLVQCLRLFTRLTPEDITTEPFYNLDPDRFSDRYSILFKASQDDDDDMLKTEETKNCLKFEPRVRKLPAVRSSGDVTREVNVTQVDFNLVLSTNKEMLNLIITLLFNTFSFPFTEFNNAFL